VTVAFVFDGRAWEDPRARWTITTLAPLLDAPWREVVVGAATRPDELLVFVGEPASAPPDCAAWIPLSEWPELRAATLERVEQDGAPFAAPGARITPVDGDLSLPREWLPSLWHVLAREEEREDALRDQWSCYSGTATRLAKIGLLDVPWVNFAATALRARLDRWCVGHGTTLEREPRWKNGAPFAVALSHDVDDVRLRSLKQSIRLLILARSHGSYAARGGLGALNRAIWSRLGPGIDPYSCFERWCEEETRRGFRSTYFVFARPHLAHEYDALYALEDRVAFEGGFPRVEEMFRALADRGFEIGLHGSYESWTDDRALERQRARLIDSMRRDVRSTRQHFLRLDVQRTWDAQEHAGFATDATLGYNEAVGFRAGIAAPFHPWDALRQRGRALLETPLTLMDGALFRGLALSEADAVATTLAHLEAVERCGGMAGLLWHPNAAAERLFPGWWKCFLAAADHLVARGAWVTSVGEIAEWWFERNRRLSGGID
jgi:peptidoglycan/xylan/chitin deacetylase (PgdA/CDA1 family)